MATAKPAAEAISVKAAVDPKTGFVTVNVFDGTRQAMPHGTQILLTVRDGAQNQLFRDFVPGPSVKELNVLPGERPASAASITASQ